MNKENIRIREMKNMKWMTDKNMEEKNKKYV